MIESCDGSGTNTQATVYCLLAAVYSILLSDMTNMIRVAAIQMVSTADVESNLNDASRLLREAAEKGAELVVLPEYFPLISDDETAKLQHKEAFGAGPLQDFLAENASQHAFWLMGGTIPLTTEQADKVSSSCLLYDPHGKCVSRYDKIHLFNVDVSDEKQESYNESATITAGNKIVVAETPFGNIGMSVCYDLRFPELYRQMLEKDVSIITVPSAFTETTGKRHWEMLLRARAVENLCFVIAPNQGGRHSDTRFTWGHSMIIGPWGDILGSLEKGPGVVVADIDRPRQQALRTSFPALQHRKLHL